MDVRPSRPKSGARLHLSRYEDGGVAMSAVRPPGRGRGGLCRPRFYFSRQTSRLARRDPRLYRHESATVRTFVTLQTVQHT